MPFFAILNHQKDVDTTAPSSASRFLMPTTEV